MRISHWLTRLQNRRPVRQSRRLNAQQATESLERRTLLTTVGILTGPSELTIFVDDGDAATVQRNSTTGNVEVLDANGQAYTSIPSIQAGQLTALNIFADDADNVLSVAPVNSSEFSMLSTIVIDAGDGDDVITGSDDFGEMIDGNDGADTINAGGGDDTIDGGDGNDSILGGAGMDLITGDDGQDTIDGGADADNIDAGNGNDSVVGGDGDDVINSGDGLDTVDGGVGRDNINGMSGNDVLNGGADNDTIFGGSENDTISGGDGDDFLNGQAGNDVANGDAGNDTALGGGGKDSLVGGDGDDILNGQSGNDTLEGGTGSDRAYGGSGDDTLDGGAGNDTLRGHSGNDTLIGGGDSDNLDGGSGNDVVQSGDAGAQQPSISITDVTLNEGNPFGTAIVSPFGGPGSVRTPFMADLDGDGDLDFAIIQGASIAIVFNAGGGSFTAGPILPFPLSPNSIIGDVDGADFDGDGNIDLVASPEFAFSQPTDVSQLYFGLGGGTFAVPIPLPIGSTEDLQPADVNNDGFVDLLGISGNNSDALVSLNDGTGTFATPVVYSGPPGLAPSGDLESTAADFNGDGFVDYALVRNNTVPGSMPPMSTVTVFLNNGDGTLGTSTLTLVPELGSIFITNGDVDGDGDIDLLSTDFFGRAIQVLDNDGTGAFQLGQSIPISQGAVVDTVDVADVDLDGDQDIVAGFFGLPPGTSGTQVLINTGGGNFQESVTLLRPDFGSSAVFAADFDGDGRVDLANFGGSAMYVYLGLTPIVAVFDVTLSDPATQVVTVDFVTQDVTAMDPSDFFDFSGTVTFLPGTTTQQVSVRLVSDGISELDENFVVNLSNPTNATVGDSQGHARIVNDDTGPSGPLLSVDDVTFAVEGDSGMTTMDFTVTLSSAPTAPVTVSYETQDGTAIDGVDYVGTQGSLTFSATVLSQTVSVQVLGDMLNEGTETFFLNLLNPIGVVLSDSQGQATITDDDGSRPILIPDDTLNGGSGNDTIIGSIGNDRIEGGSGNDSINGGVGNDSIQGGNGNDTIDSGSGDDTVAGQSGDDVISTGSGNDTILWNGLGNGTDTVLESMGVQTVTVQGDSGVNNFEIDSNLGLLRVSEGVASITVSVSTTTVNVFGGSEADTITINPINDTRAIVLNVDGQGDDDTITAFDSLIGDVRMFLNGGNGNDTITGSRDGDSIRGDNGDDSLIGGLGNDNVDGGDGNDSLNGLDGNDTLLGNIGNDLLDGGDGDDSLSGSLGNDTALGGLGNDSLFGGFGQDVLNGNSGNDVIDGGRDNDQVLGGSGDDSLKGGTGADTIRGNSGSDLIKGGDGDDRILADSGNDIVDGGDGDDDINGGNGNDILNGNDGNDTINGMSGADTLLGGDGNDNQIGGSGIDSLYGEEGDDSLMGGGSIDQFNGGEGIDVLVSPDAGEFDDNNLAIETSVMEALALLNGF